MKDMWYKLDNAAKLFPALNFNNQTSYFRLEAYLKEDVDKTILSQALTYALERFPTFSVKLKKGLFWYYFDYNDNNPNIFEETDILFSSVNTYKHNNFLFTLKYYKNRIALELFHALTDGTGGMEFFKCILYYYLKLSGKNIENDGSIKTLENGITYKESEDSFSKYYIKKVDKIPYEPKAYRFHGETYRGSFVSLINLKINLNDIKKVCKEYNTTITKYLVASYMKVKGFQWKKLFYYLLSCIILSLEELVWQKRLMLL